MQVAANLRCEHAAQNMCDPTKTLNSKIRLWERWVSGVSRRASEIGSVAAENMSLPETCHGEMARNITAR